nr:hypothetical protein [Aquimarina algiphila]
MKGRKFFELHLKLEEFYNDAVIKVDEIAERILTLEGEYCYLLSKKYEIKTVSNKL